MNKSEYATYDAIGLAELVKSGETTPNELMTTALATIDECNSSINAIVLDLRERAQNNIDALPEGPLKGVPFLVKDLKLTLAGTVTTEGARLNRNHVAQHDTYLAEKYIKAGLNIIGKTNTPEMGIMGTTEPRMYGPCRNPWNLNHTAGGSSGGSAAAVAAGCVPAAHGGDGGGSIRIPASACGLFGFKPTRGRVSNGPLIGESWGGFVQQHALTRSVRDSALLLDIADTPNLGEPYAQPPKSTPFIQEVNKATGVLKIAFTTETLLAGQTHPECIEAVENTAHLLREMGHKVDIAMPQFDKEKMVKSYFTVVAASVAAFVDDVSRQAGVKPKARNFEPATWMLALIGWKTSAADYVHAMKAIQIMNRKMADFFSRYDIFVSSVMAQPPAQIGLLPPNGKELLQIALLKQMPFKKLLDIALNKIGDGKLSYTPNTQLFNMSGLPAMSVPLHWTREQLPIGVQFAASFGNDALLFRMAAELERAKPWFAKQPALVTKKGS